VVSNGSELEWVDVAAGSGRPLVLAPARGDQPPPKDAYWHVHFTPGGKELWAMDGQRHGRTIERFECPVE
jgi:hypothetical protein